MIDLAIRQIHSLSPALWPSLDCEIVIAAKKAFCWVSAKGWDMEQPLVCSLCQHKSKKWRLANWRRCLTCASRVAMKGWVAGIRQCFECRQGHRSVK